MRKDQGRTSVYPSSDLLLDCQLIFHSLRPDFAPQQVFIAIKKSGAIGLVDETHFLFRAMQQRLCASGVYDSDEGHLIRLAIAFVRVCEVTPPGANVPREGKLTDLYPLYPGIWKIWISGESDERQGSLAELVDTIRYKLE